MSNYEREITPRLTVLVDDSACIVLRVRNRDWITEEFTITNVGAFKDALDDARTFARVMAEG